MESMGVASGCGFKEVYRFPHITYPYSSCICSFFAAASLLFVNFLYLRLYLYISGSTYHRVVRRDERALDGFTGVLLQFF